MTVEEFIRAMPKAELNVQLEGAFRKETLLTISEQNDIPDTMKKKYRTWVNLLKDPNFARLDEIIRTTSEWLMHPDDITRLVYDAGVYLARQNIKYAEVGLSPVLFNLPTTTYENFLSAVEDGRDRVQRGWGVNMKWILTVPRDEPRRADEISRSAATATSRKNNVVGFALLGPEKAQPAGQFERAFATARKKEVPHFASAGGHQGAEGVLETFENLNPQRLIDGWGTAKAPDIVNILTTGDVPLVISMARALSLGWTDSYSSYPLRSLYDQQVPLVISADMPTYFNSTLNDEYLAAVEHGRLTLDELQEVALNAVRYSLMPEGEKEAMIADFRAEYQRLRSEIETAEVE